MRIDIITLFPEMFETPLRTSIVGRALGEDGLAEAFVHDLRPYGEGSYHKVDDHPYGGGAGMILMPEPLSRCLEYVRQQNSGRVICLSAAGIPLTQAKINQLATADSPDLILVCGHYEGIDKRFIDLFVDEEISIGEYVLSGGELPALVLIDAIIRQIPGAPHNKESAQEESFSDQLDGKREYPHYTRPEKWCELAVPEVLLSGNHAEIDKWRKQNLR